MKVQRLHVDFLYTNVFLQMIVVPLSNLCRLIEKNVKKSLYLCQIYFHVFDLYIIDTNDDV